MCALGRSGLLPQSGEWKGAAGVLWAERAWNPEQHRRAGRVLCLPGKGLEVAERVWEDLQRLVDGAVGPHVDQMTCGQGLLQSHAWGWPEDHRPRGGESLGRPEWMPLLLPDGTEAFLLFPAPQRTGKENGKGENSEPSDYPSKRVKKKFLLRADF